MSKQSEQKKEKTPTLTIFLRPEPEAREVYQAFKKKVKREYGLTLSGALNKIFKMVVNDEIKL